MTTEKQTNFYYEIAPESLRLKELTYLSDCKLEIGQIVSIRVKNKECYGTVIKEVDKPDFKCLPIENISNKYFSKNMVAIAKFISTYYVCETSEALSIFEPFDDTQFTPANFKQKTEFSLSEKQLEAYHFCKNHAISLLFGDTGSGKTEIYIKLIEDALKESKSAIYLLPEISLTPQIEKRLKVVFGEQVAIWHSKQSKKTKENILNKIKSGEIMVVAGPRSALFLPISNLGVIIVDEEHDDAFKSEKRPRYNAKDMAIYMGNRLSIKVILGSATPSLTSYKNIASYRLKGGYYSSSKQWVFENSQTSLNENIEEEVKKSLKNNSQSIMFIPTRANFKYITCNNCFKNIECPFCSVSMSLHLNDKQLKCHYCGFSQYIPNNCPQCEVGLLGFHRIGTSEVVAELSTKLPDKVFVKFDRDEITTETKLKKTLSSFNNGEIDMLIGTQMLSKGHDYHNVDSAIILGIDSILAQSDFRARERALSLLIQIAGRAGRKNSAKIIVQTQNREFFEKYIYDYEEFIKDEIIFRQKLYPPHKRMARLIFADKNSQTAQKNMNQILNYIKDKKIEIVGYGEAAINKIAGKYRFDILIRAESHKALLDAIYSVDTALFETDMDPISFT